MEVIEHKSFLDHFLDFSLAQYQLEEVGLRGQGPVGVPRVHIVENKFGYLSYRGGHGGHLAEKFLKKYCS